MKQNNNQTNQTTTTTNHTHTHTKNKTKKQKTHKIFSPFSGKGIKQNSSIMPIFKKWQAKGLV